jgi:hypothetical protein
MIPEIVSKMVKISSISKTCDKSRLIWEKYKIIEVRRGEKLGYEFQSLN